MNCPRCCKLVLDGYTHTCKPTEGWRKMETEIAELKRQLEEASKDALDAERYRWMRSFRPGLWLDGITLEPIENEGYALQLDSTIDAVIEQASSCNELHEKGGV